MSDHSTPPRPIRFRINYEKCLEGIQYLAAHQPGITQYYVGKVFFFADKAHLLDWGRPISGDRYMAMQHGPVPSTIYDILKDTSGEPDEIIDSLLRKVSVKIEANRIHVFSREIQPEFRALSRTDEEYLSASLATYGKMNFTELRKLSHQDPAYEAAWMETGLNNEMNIALWFEDRPDMLDELLETAPIRKVRRIAA